MNSNEEIGVVVGGSLTEGVEVRLNPDTDTENLRVGAFVRVQGNSSRFFGIITDIYLGMVDRFLGVYPPGANNKFISDSMSGIATYGNIQIEPRLVLTESGFEPSRTIPAHFSNVFLASQEDVDIIFGKEDESHFYIGSPLDMETKLCLDIGKIVERSNGVFGKSGTGKTFLTRLLLIGILQSKKAVNLVFDMQSEYGWKGYSEAKGGEVKGLKQLFSSEVQIFSIDEESSKRRKVNPDFMVEIGYDDIQPEDIQMLRETLNLSEVAADATHSLAYEFGYRNWLKEFLALRSKDSIMNLADKIGVNSSALASLHNRLLRLVRLPFVKENGGNNSVKEIIMRLQKDINVVLEFGRYGNDFSAYILVANLLTRRIYEQYASTKEKAMGDRDKEPKPLVITIEEAHKFLSPSLAGHTIFGTIAREMRKYNVTLLIVDQRPSGIDEEIMSQIGTKFTCLLDNERDVDSVLTGASGSRKLKSILSKLDSKQQALCFGHALPMPVQVQTREYGSSESYKNLSSNIETDVTGLEKNISDLFGDISND